jgi:hypothetical protein
MVASAMKSNSGDPAAKRVRTKADSVRGVADVKEIARFALDAWAGWLEQPDGQHGTSSPASRTFNPATIWRIRGRLREMTKGDDEELVAVLNQLLKHRVQFERALIVWIDLIEVLVQQAERRYPLPGRGQLKRGEVKSAIVYLLRRRRLGIPNVPDFLEPVIVDIFADFTVNAIVALANDHGLWIAQDGPDHPILRGFKWALFRFWRLVRPAVEPLGHLFSRIYMALRYPTPISPALRQALEAVSSESILASRRGLLDDVIEVKKFIGEHADSLVAGIQLVGIVVQELEKFASLDGAEKKRYATDLVFEILNELGFRTPGPLMQLIIETAVGFAIDATVDLFNKRGLFDHPSGSRAV